MLDVGAPSRLRFTLLGRPRLAGGDVSSVRISAQKGLALLAYLAMQRGAAVSRAVLADLLWGDRIDAQARQNLRQLILTLRRDLRPRHGALLQADDQSIALAAEMADVDAVQFETWAGSSDLKVKMRCMERPWGPFLNGFSVGAEAFDEWAAAERHRIDAIATRAFSDLARQFDSAGDGERAILAMERLIAIDPAEEERHRRLLLLERRYRGADAALARGKELAAMLKREVDAEHEPATTALIDEIRREAKTSAGRAAPLIRDTGEAAIDAAQDTDIADNDRARERSPWLRWLPRRPAARLQRLALLAGGALIATCTVLFWTFADRLSPDGAPAPDRAASRTAAHDPWQSPPLPSGRVASAETRKGVIPIVILPFKTYEDGGSIRALADMMTDDLTNILSRLRYFRVISRQTAQSYRSRQIDVTAVGQELGVRYALEGSVRMHGDKLRVAAELIDTASRTVAWAARIEREDADRHVVQDEIVARLARELHVGSLSAESARRSSDADADALSYRGMAALHAANSDIRLESYNRAQALFAAALQRDPQNVLARIGLASCHINVALKRLVPNPGEHLDKGHEIITALLREKPMISGAHFQLGLILQSNGKLTDAIGAFERALELNPSNAGSHAHIGFALARMGRATEGLEHIRYAMRLSPRDPALAAWLEFAGAAELELDRHREAIDNFRRSIALTPAYPRPWAGLAAAQALAGDLDEARRSIERLRTLAPGLTADELFQRFGRGTSQSLRLRDGLRLALAQAVSDKQSDATK
jgi:TolB-like protein/DNA-binding SARP family transcriptional activator